jgi:flagellar biogenesis protein FliO
METVQQICAVLFVLALLGGSLYWLRSRGMAQLSGGGLGRGLTRGGKRRMQSVERLSLTPQHSLHLVSVGGRVVLVAAGPGGCSILEGNWEETAAIDPRAVRP